MEKLTVDKILASAKEDNIKNTPLSFTAKKMDLKAVSGKGIDIAKFDVPIDAVYDRLNDGTHVAKYENYLGATGNEDRLGKEQSWYEQAGYGLLKNFRKMGNYALDSIVGTVYGAVEGISAGSFNKVWDNEFSKNMDDWNKQLDYKLPNYYTDEQKNRGLLSSMLTTNFLFNDVAGGLAFVGGAILPDVAVGIISGGTAAPKIGLDFAKLGGKIGLKSGAKTLYKAEKIANKVDDAIRYSKGRDVIRQLNRKIYGETAGNVVSTAGFLIRSSNFEAGMEARQNFHDAVDNYIGSFEEKNGRQPTNQELNSFMNDARSAANGVYGANMAILSLSNAAMFGKTFDINVLPGARKSVGNFFNRAIGLGVNTAADGTRVRQQANRMQKIAGNTFKLLEKPAIEGLYEEGFQGVAGKTMQNYLESQYDPKSNGGESLFASMSDAFSEQYGTKEGWKEMGIGMLIGFAGGAMQPGAIRSGEAFSGLGKNSYANRRSGLEKDLATANEGLGDLKEKARETANGSDGVSILRAMSRASSAMKSRSEANSAPTYDNLRTNLDFIRSQEHIKLKGEIRKDFEAVVDNMELSPEQQDAIESQGMDLDAYKDSMKNEFNTTLKDYNFAKRAVKGMGLDSVEGITEGNKINLEDAMIFNIMMGKSSEANAKAVGMEIENLTGVNGIMDHLAFFNGLSQDKKAKISERKSKNEEVAKLKEEAIDIQNKLAGIGAKRKRGEGDPVLEQRFNALTQKLVIANDRATKLEREVQGIDKALEADFKTPDISFDERTGNSFMYTVGQTIDEIGKLDNYVQALKDTGKTVEANTLESLLYEYKSYADASREFVNMHRKMVDTNFFSTKDGKGLLDSILGPKYKMSEELRNAIQENEAAIDASMNLVGLRGHSSVMDAIERSIENNPELSDREKYRLEAILRLQLNMKIFDETLDAISELKTSADAGTETPQGPGLKGDTVILRRGLDIQADNMTSLDLINQTIDAITENIDTLRNGVNSETEEGEVQGEKRIRIIDSPEYSRYAELETKTQKGTITPEEIEEKETLKADIDQWLLVTGTVAEGVRLSDLVRQKVALENAEVAPTEKVEELTEEDVIKEVEFSSNTSRSNYDLGQTYEAVTTRLDEKAQQIIVSGVKPEDIPSIFTETDAEGNTIPIAFDHFIDQERKNLVIPLGENGSNLALVNKVNSNVSILPTNKGLTTTYSVAIVHQKDMNGNPSSTYMQSVYKEDYTEQQNANAIYDLEDGTPLTLRVDTRDAYNQEKLYKYEQATTKKAKAEAKEVLRKELRITVFDDKGNFIATLKGKRSNGNKSDKDIKFEQLRDSIVDNDEFLETISGISDLHVVEGIDITTKKIMLGQPNFLFSKNDDGSVSIVSKPIDTIAAKKVLDFGYVENGIAKTRSGEKGIDFTFMKKAVKKQGVKTPFIVFKTGSRMIAFPAKLVRQPKKDTTPVQDVFKSGLSPTSKVIKLNQFLAESGVDITKPGNAFYAVGNTNNLTEEFFNKKLDQLGGIDYFYALDKWVSEEGGVTADLDIAKVLEQVLVNIDLNNPLHSPKVAMDLSRELRKFSGDNTMEDEDIIEKEEGATVKSTSSSKTSGKASSRYAGLKSEKDLADSAKDETNKEC